MKIIELEPIETLIGEVKAPPSKSYTHRALIAASLADGESKIKNPLICQDTEATLNVIKSYGAKVNVSKNLLTVVGIKNIETPNDVLNCKESGTTIRFATPILSFAKGISILTGEESLRRRPMQPLIDALNQLKVQCFSAKGDGYPPIIVFGGSGIRGEAFLPGNVSSQFISGLLFAAPLAKEDVKIKLTTPLESKPYVEMTLKVLENHNIHVSASNDRRIFFISSNQIYKPFNHEVPGDYSSATFLLAAAALTKSKIKVKGLKDANFQADSAIINILKEMGAQVKVGEDYVEVSSEGDLTGIEFDAKNTPDLVPALTVLGCIAKGETKILNVERLRIKESDRVKALISELTKMGGKLTFKENTLIVKGECKLKGAEINPYDDHRIAMACAIAALKAEGKTKILNPNCIKKSYPNFFKDLRKLGVKIAWK
ncbi:MAG: 3-phosphoshikimate 1-carboxyvinyltransferase [Candidatus Bathyarchaeia archaeon]